MTPSNVLEQNLRMANRVTAEELMPGDFVVLGHWHGFTARQVFLVLSSTLRNNTAVKGTVVVATLLGGGHVSERHWNRFQWIEICR